MLFEKRHEIRRTDLFFSFNEKNDVERQPPFFLNRLFGTKEVDKMLSLVISTSSAPDLTVAKLRFKWRRVPKLYGINWLHIVVPVYQHGSSPLLMLISSDHNRMFRSLVEFRSQPYSFELALEPLRIRSDIICMGGIG